MNIESTKQGTGTSSDCDKAVVSGSVILKPTNKLNMILFTIFIIWIAFLADLNFTLSTKNTTYELKYNGLLWVSLDYYTIVKYKSDDKLLKWFEFKRTEHLR